MILKVIPIFIATYFGVSVLNKMLLKLIKHEMIARLAVQVITVVGWAVGVITILGTLNVDVTALVAGLGLTGFAVGFACKDILSNILSGLIIMLYSPFKYGEKITVKNKTGIVKEINFRYIKLINDDGLIILIPNSVVLNEVVLIGDAID